MTPETSPAGTFLYKALRIDGSVVEGRVVAATGEGATDSLMRSGLYVANLRRVDTARTRRSSASLDDHATALGTFADLLDAGLPPLRALQLLRETAPPSWRGGLESACISVEQGYSVAASFRSSTLSLPPIVDGLIQAGEAGMGLANATRQAAGLLKQRAELRQSLISALAYPAILLTTGAASVALLVMVVLPKFAVILASLGTELPTSTRLILAVGAALRAVGPSTALALLIGAFALRTWKSTERGARECGELALRVPLIGRIVHALSASQAVHAMGSLLASGVPMPTALEYAASAAGNSAVEYRILMCRDAVRSGDSLSASFVTTSAVPPLIIRLARAGEETGRLSEMLVHGATLERHKAEQWIAAAVRLIEPALILAFGAAIALVASALFQAMYAVRPGI